MKKESLRIVFMGTPEFAVDTLRKLRSNHYNVVGIVTQPDKAVGRHQTEMQPSPVKQYAKKYFKGVPILQPEKMKDPIFLEQLKKLNANLQVVVAFRMLPEVVWSMPKYGTFNVHAALLPQYRGAAPINWAVINGEKKTGVTTFFLDKDIDTGRIICQKEYRIKKNYNVETVYNGLMDRGARLCLETLDMIIASKGYPKSIPQEKMIAIGSELHTAPKIFKETCEINWNQSAKRVYDFIRGLSPCPGAWTTLVSPNGKETVLKIYKARLANFPHGVVASTGVLDGEPCISANDELLVLEEVLLAGKKRMSGRDFLNGIKNFENYIIK